MNIDQLKSEWQLFSLKLEQSNRLNEQVIMSMLRERSRSRVSRINRDNKLLLMLMIAELILLTAIFAGNPFDFVYAIQYVPYGLLAIGLVMAIANLVASLYRFNVDINQVNLQHFLTKTIAAYEKRKKTEGWFGLMFLSIGVLSAFSFLPNKLATKSMGSAIGETMIPVLITLAIYFIAFKMGAFRNSKRQQFEQDLKELSEMKAASSELNDIGEKK